MEANLGASIPPELFPLIIENVDGGDYLKACCLVSRAWCKFAQPKIYAQLYLSTESECDCWDRKFDDYPHLAPAVTSLHFWGSSLRMDDPDDEDSFVVEHVLDNDAVRRLIPRLRNVTDIKIEEFSWSSVQDLPAIIWNEGIRSLEIARTSVSPDQLLDLVHSMPHLQSLALSSFQFDVDLEHDPLLLSLHETGDLLVHLDRDSYDICPPHVQRLQAITLDHVQRQANVIMWLLSPRFSLTTLTQASLSWHFTPHSASEQIVKNKMPQLAALDSLIASIGPNVTDLALRVHSGFVGFTRQRGSKLDPCLRRCFYLPYTDMSLTY